MSLCCWIQRIYGEYLYNLLCGSTFGYVYGLGDVLQGLGIVVAV